MPEHPAHTGAVHPSAVFIGANHKSKIGSFRGTFYTNAGSSSKNHNLEIFIFDDLIFCHIMAAYPIAIGADLVDKNSI
jgi:hypothetical protein